MQNNLFPSDIFDRIRLAYSFLEEEKLRDKLKAAQNSLRVFKGHSTKRKNKKIHRRE